MLLPQIKSFAQKLLFLVKILKLTKKLKLEELGRIDVETFKATEKIPIVVVLDNVRSMHNVGAVFRTADGFLVEKNHSLRNHATTAAP